MTGTPPTEPCLHCAAPVIVARVGARLDETPLDPVPVPWDEGGRIRLRTQQQNPARPIADRVTIATFGLTVYRRHAETCEAPGQRRRQATKAKTS